MPLNAVTNLFGVPPNPAGISTYSSPVVVATAALYENVDAIFSCKCFSEPDLLDGAIKKWVSRGENEVLFQEVDIRAGIGSIVLGYANQQESCTLGILTPGYGLPYLLNSLRTTVKSPKQKLLLSVAALDVDSQTGSILCDYVTPLNAAGSFGIPVITPVCHAEIATTALLSLAVAKYSSRKSAIHLFDGPNYAKTVFPVETKAIAHSNVLERLEKVLPSDPSVDNIVDNFNKISGVAPVDNFSYIGIQDAETVFVTYGSLESEWFHRIFAERSVQVGHLSVRIAFPFNASKFIHHISHNAKRIIIVDQSLDSHTQSFLQVQIHATLFSQRRRNIHIESYNYKPDFVWSSSAILQILDSFNITVNEQSPEVANQAERFIYWSLDNSENAEVAARLIFGLSLMDRKQISSRTKYDNITGAGIFQAQFAATSQTSTDNSVIPSNIDDADVVVVQEDIVLKSVDAIGTAKIGGTLIVVVQKSLKDLNWSDLSTYLEHLKLGSSFMQNLIEKNVKLCLIDSVSIKEREKAHNGALSYVTQAVFWKYAFGYNVAESVRSIWNSAGSNAELLASYLNDSISTAFDSDVIEIPRDFYPSLSKSLKEMEANVDVPPQLPIFITENSFTPNPRGEEPKGTIGHATTSDTAKRIVFKEAFDSDSLIRPDLPVKNYIVKVKENRRLTPEEYDRNIFHIEFDITGTGLTYNIGEALGIHARNDTESVQQFLTAYGLKEDQIIMVPNKDDPTYMESRTVLQTFVENLDIFGKPPKRFYESLVDYATDEVEKKKLEDLVAPAGASTLKMYQDIEYYTYVDIFNLYPSARPPLETLMTIISPLKRREYSIASSQKVHPNEIHLLIVVVDWIDKQGRKRFGQSSKYISDLRIGDELVVSVKPSVMKLPPSPKQPVIMSGLGTGLAPFKAIVEEKLWQKEQGHEIGEVFLFLGSRHKREEYLYGELWEGYKDAGIITHIGAAFSRDQPQKIYIQDRIRESLPALKKAMTQDEGSFYLCGPTWPVPDITSALQDILDADAKERGVKIDSSAAIEELKEASRYILEVY